jgi:hypothetical protein
MTPHALNPEDLKVDSFDIAQSSSSSSLPTFTDPTAETYCFVCDPVTYGG